jgi:hypothetical protein
MLAWCKKHFPVVVTLAFFGVSLPFLAPAFRTRPPVVLGGFCDLPLTSLPFIPIQNTGSEALQLDGWVIGDSQGTSTLPSLLLPPQGIARVWSGPQTAYPVDKPHYWLTGISGSNPTIDTVPSYDLYVGRAQTTWSWAQPTDISLQAPYLFSQAIRPDFLFVTCDVF